MTSTRWRQRALEAAAGLGLALALAACGGGDDSPASAAQRSKVALAETTSSDSPSTEQLLQWAQTTYPDLFPDAPPLATVTHDGRSYRVRSYGNGNHLATANGEVFGLGDFTQGRIQGFGPLASWADVVCPVVGCGAWDLARGKVFSEVTVQPPTVTGLVQTTTRGSRIQPPSITGTVTGNVNALANRVLALIVEDPAGLFGSPGLVRLEAGSPWRYSVELPPRILSRTGRFTGDLRVFACLDPACATRLAGTPLTIPYDVTIVAGATSTPTRLDFSSIAGVPPAAQTLRLSFHPQATDTVVTSVTSSWLVDTNRPGDLVAVAVDWQGDVARIQPEAALVGNYRGAVRVTASYRFGGQPREETFEVPVQFAVAPNPALAIPSPARVSWRVTHAEGITSTIGLRFALADFTRLRFEGTDYLSHPSSETDAARRTSWAVVDTSSGVQGQYGLQLQVCFGQGEGRRCLAPGVYTAEIRFRAWQEAIRDGAVVVTREETIRVPVEMTVTGP